MGNTCCSFGFIKRSKRAVLLDTTGNIREIKLPVKSAELMIEEPGQVIAPVDELRLTRRISALPADEELQAGKVYLLIPASRVHSKASPYEMAITEEWDCGKKKKPRRNSNKVSLVSAVSEGEDGGDLFAVKITGIPCCQRLGNQCQRRWNPVLEPILESF